MAEQSNATVGSSQGCCDGVREGKGISFGGWIRSAGSAVLSVSPWQIEDFLCQAVFLLINQALELAGGEVRERGRNPVKLAVCQEGRLRADARVSELTICRLYDRLLYG